MLIFVSLRVACFVKGMLELFLMCVHIMLCAVVGAGGFSDAVDIFSTNSGTWSTAALSAARGYLAATSLPSYGVAIFAGGRSACYCCHVDFRIFASGLLCEGDA